MRALLPLAAVALVAFLLAGCGGDPADTLESLAGTPAATHIVEDVEAMAHSCKEPSKQARRAGIRAYTGLAELAAIHPNATFGPEGTDVTLRRLLRRAVEKTGHCFGVTVDPNGRYRVERAR